MTQGRRLKVAVTKSTSFFCIDGNAMKEAKARSPTRHYSDTPDDEFDEYFRDLGEDDRAKGKGGKFRSAQTRPP